MALYKGNTGDFAGWAGNFKTCTHNRQPVAVGQYTVWATAWCDSKPEARPYPDLGVYLANCWLGDASKVYVYNYKAQSPRGYYPNILMDWPDCSAPDIDTFRWLCKVVRKALEKGEQVEVGCLGAHGRTGTLLAGLIGQVEGVGAAKAVAAVRSRLCSECVECYAQEAAVYKLLGERPPKPPPLPEKVSGVMPPSDTIQSYVWHDGKLWQRFYQPDGSFEDIEVCKVTEGAAYD